MSMLKGGSGGAWPQLILVYDAHERPYGTGDGRISTVSTARDIHHDKMYGWQTKSQQPPSRLVEPRLERFQNARCAEEISPPNTLIFAVVRVVGAIAAATRSC